MRRLAVGLLVTGLLLSVAGAAEAQELPVSGTFTGLGSFAIEPPCSFIHQVATLDAELSSLGAAEIDLDFCLEFAPLDFPAAGTFTLTTDDGTLAGTLSGFAQASAPGPEFPFHFDLAVATATGTLQGTTGTLTLDGSFGSAALTVHGTVSGALQLPSATPSTKADCTNGGWRSLGDDQGQPFRNQGQCVRSVAATTAGT
jgi:hypothetical protein